MDEKLPKGFKNKIIEYEFQLEKGQVTKDSVMQLIEMYTQAASHYDTTGEKSQAEIYRSKIQLLFMKPQILMMYSQQSMTQANKPPD